jgi:hypothetical protein
MDEKPLSETRTARVWSWLLFGAVSIFAAWALLRMYVTKLGLMEAYAELDAMLPGITLLVMNAIYPLMVPVVMLAGFVAHWRIRDRFAALAVNGILLVLVMLLLDIHRFGMHQPLVCLIDSMQATGNPP